MLCLTFLSFPLFYVVDVYVFLCVQIKALFLNLINKDGQICFLICFVFL